MKKLLLFWAMVGLMATACQGGLDNEGNGGISSVSKIELSQQIIDVSYKAGTHSILVTSPYSWEAVSKSDWIEVETPNGIAGTEPLSFFVEENVEFKERKGTILLTNTTYNLAAELYVVQKASVPEISIDKSELNFTAEGGSQNITITTNLEYMISTTADWIQYTKRNYGITVIVSNNVDVKERTAYVTIYNSKYNISNDIKVTQLAFVPELGLSTTTSCACDYRGCESILSFTSNFDYDVTTTADWLKCTKVGDGVKISVSKNYYTESRTAEVKIYSERYNIECKTIIVTQGPSPMEIGAIVVKNGVRGVVFYVDNTTTKIVSVDEAYLAWSTEDITTGATDLDNGINNMAKIKTISSWEIKYPAFKWCADHGEGWYFPARNELAKIYANQTINDTLNANGYTAIGINYFSSTDSQNVDSYAAWGLMGELGYYYYFDKDEPHRVRAVLAF